MEPSVIAKQHPVPFKGYLWHLFPFLHTLDTQSYYFPQFRHLYDFTSAGEAGENPSLKVSNPEYSMVLVWSQSRWQWHDGLLWFLWRWSRTIIMPPMIYCSSPSEAASVFPLRLPASDEGEERVEFGTEVYMMSQKQLHSCCNACCTLHNWNLYIPTEQNFPVCRAVFDCMKAAVWLHDRHLATHHFPLRSCLRPSDVNFCQEEPWK